MTKNTKKCNIKVAINEDISATIRSYKYNTLQIIWKYILYLVTFGLLFIIFRAYPQIQVYFLVITKCDLDHLEERDVHNDRRNLAPDSNWWFSISKINFENYFLIVKNDYEITTIIQNFDFFKLHMLEPHSADTKKVRTFIYQELRFYWDEISGSFKLTNMLIDRQDFTISDCLEYSALNFCNATQADSYLFKSSSTSQTLYRNNSCQISKIYRPNAMSVAVPSIYKILVNEILTPFYLFQVFAMAIWYWNEYETYATSILIMSSVSIGITIHSIRQDKKKIKKMIDGHNIEGHFQLKQIINQFGKFENIMVTAEELVQGDVVFLDVSRAPLIAADILLIEGNCIVNESMLTGESTPVRKLADDDDMMEYDESLEDKNYVYDEKVNSSNTLLCGTKLLETSKVCKGLVIRTGFYTKKGQMLSSILYPKPIG